MNILWIGVFFLCVLKYQFVYRLYFGKQHLKAKTLAVCFSIVSGAILLLTFLNPSLLGLFTYLSALISTVLLIDVFGFRSLCRVLAVIFATTSFEQTSLFVIRSIIDSKASSLLHFFCNLLILISVSILLWVKRVFKRRFPLLIRHWDSVFTLLILFALISATATVSFFEYSYFHDSNLIIHIGNMFPVIYFFVGILGLALIYVEYKSEQSEESATNEKRLYELQKNYYEALINKEKDTKHFRHDIINHLVCIEKYAFEGEIPSLLAYLNSLKEHNEFLFRKNTSTGNTILDILSDYYINQLPPNTDYLIKGYFDCACKDDILCSIYSNLLKNAVEELILCDNSSRLVVILESGRLFSRITVKNTISKKEKEKYYKDEACRHGFGIRIVESAVNRIGGEYRHIIADDMYIAEVSFKKSYV